MGKQQKTKDTGAGLEHRHLAIGWAGLLIYLSLGIILEILQGNIDPQINAIGTFVFVTSMTLVIIAQVILIARTGKKALQNG